MNAFSSSESHFTVDGTSLRVSKAYSSPANKDGLTVWQKEVYGNAENNRNDSFSKDQPSEISNAIPIKCRIIHDLTTSNQRDLR